MAHLHPSPGRWVSRVWAVALEEGGLESPVPQEVLGGQAGQVGLRRARRSPTEVDGPHHPGAALPVPGGMVVDEPVAGLPVTVGRHEPGRRGRPRLDLGPELPGDIRVDAVRFGQPRQDRGVLACFVTFVDGARLVVQQSQQAPGLSIGVRIVSRGVAFDESAREEFGGQDLVFRRGIPQHGGQPTRSPRPQPLSVRAQLADQVPVVRRCCFDDETLTCATDLQHSRRDQAPTVVVLDDGPREPRSDPVTLA